jgi:membrane fusion protein (multidrug efflux system)
MARKRVVWLVLILLVTLAAGGTVMKLKGSQEAEAASKQKEVVTLEFAANDVAVVQMRELSQVIPLTGNLQPLNQTVVKAKVAGEIREALVREGEAVKKGQVLARFDTVELQARLDEKIANLEGARAQLNLAEKNQQNNQFLLKQKFISQNAYDNTQSNFQVSQATLKSLEAQVVLTRTALNDAVVRAPLDGSIAKRHVQPGEKVSQDMPLFSIVDLSRMELQAPVPASEIGNVKLGQEATIRVEGIEGQSYGGRVERINPVSEAGSRSINIYIKIENPERALRGGMFASGVLNLSKSAPLPAIPVAAVRAENGLSFVYALEGGKLARHPVELGKVAEQEGYVEIRSGLAAGAQIVTARMTGLKPGAPAVVKGGAAPAVALGGKG